MKISIITICYNSAETIEDTLRSVTSQDYADVEYVIVDGASKDNTLEIVNRYRDKITTVISEKDKGLYDALNKGIAVCTGDVIGILHSDDIYASSSVLSRVMKEFTDPAVDGAYGDLHYVDRENTDKIIRNWKSGPYREGLFLKGWMPPHPTFFVRRELYQKFGVFTTELRSSADYELMLRFIHKNKIQLSYIPEVLVKMRVGGKSNVSWKNRIRANREDRQAWKMNGLKPGLFTLIRKPLSKIFQFLR